MNTCIDCNTEDNVIHSGIDAFAFNMMDLVHSICYDCAYNRLREIHAKEYLHLV